MNTECLSSKLFIFFFLFAALVLNQSHAVKLSKLNSGFEHFPEDPHPEEEPLEAISYFFAGNITGVVYFDAKSDGLTHVHIRVSGLPSNSTHGIHIHEFGDFTRGCDSFGGHYNPHNETHGGPGKEERHEGDMGNLKCDEKGHCEKDYLDHVIKLTGEFSIIGRGVVLHAGPDDLHSNPAGNSGNRIACGVIGWKENTTQ